MFAYRMLSDSRSREVKQKLLSNLNLTLSFFFHAQLGQMSGDEFIKKQLDDLKKQEQEVRRKLWRIFAT